LDLAYGVPEVQNGVLKENFEPEFSKEEGKKYFCEVDMENYFKQKT